MIAVMCCDTVNRGLAYADGKIILEQADTTVVALNAKTGAEVWGVKNGDPAKGETMAGAPLVVKDKVIVGVSRGEYGILGRVTAYELENGKLLWTAYTQGSDDVLLFDPEKTTSLGKPVGKDSSLKTWKGDQWKIGGGPTWWGWMSYDPELDLFYYGSGNPDTWNPVQRPGGNKWTMTIFARNPDTGVAKWVYQMTPHDHWDYDGVNEMILADIPVHGSTRALRSQWLQAITILVISLPGTPGPGRSSGRIRNDFRCGQVRWRPYWPGSWVDQTYRGSRHRRRVSESVELYPARGHSHDVRTTLTGPSRFWFAASRDAHGKRVPHLTILARVEHRLFGSKETLSNRGRFSQCDEEKH